MQQNLNNKSSVFQMLTVVDPIPTRFPHFINHFMSEDVQYGTHAKAKYHEKNQTCN
jgi:hypothetical protein